MIAVLPVVGAMAFGVSAVGSGDDGRPYVTGFELAGGRTAEGLIRLRRERELALVVRGGTCSVSEPDRIERVEHRETSTAVTAAVRMRVTPPGAEACAGAGVDLHTTLRLAGPIGDRALITRAGPYQFRLVLIPPAGRAAVRRLVAAPGRRQPSAFMYFGAACDLVAQYLTDVPERDWCFY